MVMREGAAITPAGIAIGLAGVLMTGQLWWSFLFGVGPTDVWTLAGVWPSLERSPAENGRGRDRAPAKLQRYRRRRTDGALARRLEP